MAGDPESRALIHTLVQLGKTLGIETVAEGIEEISQLSHLRREACDSGQGLLFARPLTADAVRRLIDTEGRRSERLEQQGGPPHGVARA